MRTTLFRQEALDSRREQQLGEVSLARPIALSLLTVLAAVLASGVVAFGCLGQYTRKAHVPGYLVPTEGLVKVRAPQAGTLIERRVEEGQHVRRGDVLYLLSTESPGGASAAVVAQLRARRASLERDIEQQADLARLARSALLERARGLSAELAQLRGSLDAQAERTASARAAFERYDALARQHFISEMQLAQQRERVLEQQDRALALGRTRSALERDLAALNAELAAQAPKAAATRAAIERSISALDQELAEVESRRTLVIAAPADGVVTTILAERAQSATPAAPLLTILPEGARLAAQLFVPSRSVGFVAPGQPVALRLQAFPFQHFGSQRGVVREISRTLIIPGEASLPVALNEPVYRVTVALERQSLRAYRQDVALQAGMLLDADIALDRRRLVEWLFEPVLAVAGRV